MTALGLQRLCEKTGKLVRDDGRWFLERATVDEFKAARRTLGLKPWRKSGRKRPPKLREREV